MLQILAAVDSVAEQLRARELVLIDSLQRYVRRAHYEILTPVQVRLPIECRAYKQCLILTLLPVSS